MPKNELTIIASDDREVVSRRLELFATSTTALAQIDLDLERKYQLLLKESKAEKNRLTRQVEFAEKIAIAIAEEHPEWFADKRTLETPFAEITCRRSTSHKAADPDHSIRLIEKAAAACDDEVTRARLLGLIRVTKELNIEAVECLGERELAKLRIARVRDNNYTIKLVKPAKAKASKTKKSEAPAVAAAA